MSDTTSGGQGQSDAFSFLNQLPDDQLQELRKAVRQQMLSRGLAKPAARKGGGGAGKGGGKGGGKRRKAAQGGETA